MKNIVEILSKTDISKRDILLILLSMENNIEKSIAAIKEYSIKYGRRDVKNWNISDLLSKAKPYCVRLEKGWKLTQVGVTYLNGKEYGSISPLKNEENILRSYLDSIKNKDIKSFIMEAVVCIENGLLRSSVVLSWIGALSLLQDEMFRKHISDFNKEYIRRFPKAKSVSKKDDFSIIKEYDFLQIIAGISFIGKNVKTQLERSLELRNACGHPNSLVIGLHMVQSHLEFLIKNIYSVYI